MSGFIELDEPRLDDALQRFDRENLNIMGETALFARKRAAHSLAWRWTFDALIHYRRGQMALARASWSHAFRLTIACGEPS
jgi:hypothetical protein